MDPHSCSCTVREVGEDYFPPFLDGETTAEEGEVTSLISNEQAVAEFGLEPKSPAFPWETFPRV